MKTSLELLTMGLCLAAFASASAESARVRPAASPGAERVEEIVVTAKARDARLAEERRPLVSARTERFEPAIVLPEIIDSSQPMELVAAFDAAR
jgi:hypothetical protein